MVLTFCRCSLIVLIFFCLYLRELIFRELFLIFFLRLLCVQNSSLWRAIIILPARALTIFSFSSRENTSGLLIVIYVIVFIGGLLIFLVRVAAISPQEQNIGFGFF